MSAIAAIQMTSGPDVAANLEQARALLEEAAARRLADPARAARDDDPLALETSHSGWRRSAR